MDNQTSKTLGQKISDLRAQKGISQTELAEALDVSRQSISKWETDAALPEIDKLIALSRYFSVPVGVLLGLEEQTSEPPENGELSETQLKMVQEIVDRYLAAQPKPMSKKRRTILKIAVCVAAICLAVGLSKMTGQLKNLSRQYHDLQYSINNVTNGVNYQIDSISGRVEELLKQQNNLTADYGTEILRLNVGEGRVLFSVYAVPKTYVEGMTVSFAVDNGTGGTNTVIGEENKQKFTGTLASQLTDNISLSVIFVLPDGTRQTQLLDTYRDLYSRTLPQVYLDDPLQASNGKIILDAEPVAVHITGYYGDDRGDCPKVTDCRVGLFRNKKLVSYLARQEGGEVNANGCGIYLFAAAQREEIAVAEGDEVCYAAVLEDELGRRFLQPGVRFAIGMSEYDYLLPVVKSDNAGTGYPIYPISDPIELSEWTF